MSNEDGPSDGNRPLSEEGRTISFLEQVLDIDAKCYVCGSKSWYVLDDKEIKTSVYARNAKFETISVACAQCGCLRQHLKVIVQRTLENSDIPEARRMANRG